MMVIVLGQSMTWDGVRAQHIFAAKLIHLVGRRFRAFERFIALHGMVWYAWYSRRNGVDLNWSGSKSL